MKDYDKIFKFEASKNPQYTYIVRKKIVLNCFSVDIAKVQIIPKCSFEFVALKYINPKELNYLYEKCKMLTDN